MRPMIRRSLPLAALLLTAAALPAQSNYNVQSDAEWLEQCRRGRNGNYDDDRRGRACEVRNVPFRAAGRSITIDGAQNGSIRVYAWDGDSVRISARIQADDQSDAAAAAMLPSIRVTATDRRVRAEGPGDGHRRSFSVSYVAFVPRRFDLNLDSHNGSLGVTGVNGKLELNAHNGSIALHDVAGDVRARAQNGSMNVQLGGSRWDGTGLDAETHNGSVRLQVPEKYSASLETGTVNGSIRTDIPVTVQGRISRRLNIPLGGGGAPIRVLTTNGSVTISQR